VQVEDGFDLINFLSMYQSSLW